MKVMFVIDGLGTGGAERSLAELLPGLEAEGIRSTVVCRRRRTEGVESDVVRSGARVRFLEHAGGISAVRELRRMIREESPDLLHTSIFGANLVGRLAAYRTGVPVLTSLVNTSYVPERRLAPDVAPWRLRVIRWVDGVTARRMTTRFHAITEAVRTEATASLRIPPDRIEVIHRGRDPGRLGVGSRERREAARGSLGLAPDDEVVLSVGRQEYQKGHRYLLEAWPSVLERRPRALLLLAGRSGAASDLVEALARSAGDRVRLLGHREDVPELLAAADLFAFPSLWEGLGGALIEAMALGLPIVASDLPAVREVLEPGSNAEVVRPADPAALAAAVTALLGDAERRAAYGARSRERFLERFTLDRSTAAMIDLYRRVAVRPAADLTTEPAGPR